MLSLLLVTFIFAELQAILYNGRDSETLDLAISQEDDDGIENAHFQRTTRNQVNASSMR